MELFFTYIIYSSPGLSISVYRDRSYGKVYLRWVDIVKLIMVGYGRWVDMSREGAAGGEMGIVEWVYIVLKGCIFI